MRNGGNILTMYRQDRLGASAAEPDAAPPDRLLSERASRSWLPYDLLDIKQELDERGARSSVFMSIPSPVSCPTDELARPLVKIADLGARELIWLTMMFRPARRALLAPAARTPALSYSGDMIKRSDALIATASHSYLPWCRISP